MTYHQELPRPWQRWIGPPPSEWPADTIAWCQSCDRPIRAGQPYMPRIPFLTGAGGSAHQHCPPRLTLVR